MNIKILMKILRDSYSKKENIKKFFSQPKSLNYDPFFLLNTYDKETSILGDIPYDIPYREEVFWIGDTWEKTVELTNNILIEKELSQFELDASTEEIKIFQNEALKKRNLTKNSEVIRLMEYEKENIRLKIQKAKYSDQVQSNLAMDWKDHHARFDTLRSYLLIKYNNKLPPLADNCLANTIGISVILFYKKDGNYVPYLPRRTKPGSDEKRQLAVFEGNYHCTASGAVEWNDSEISFDGIFKSDMYREIKEEVGIDKSEIKIMKPLALCREFLRGGKPQIFFAGITILSQEEIIDRRRFSIIRQQKDDLKVEIQDDQLYFSNEDELLKQINTNFITSEAYANCYYAEKFIQQYEQVEKKNTYDDNLSLKNHELLLAEYNKSVELDSKCADAYYNRAIFYREQNNYEYSLNDFDSAIKFYESLKDKKQCCLMANNIAMKSRKYDKAEEYIEQAFEHSSSEEQQHKDTYLENIHSAKQLYETNEQLKIEIAEKEVAYQKLQDAQQSIEEKNKALELEIKQKEIAQKIAHEKEKEMLSFFTHTMRNALATAPESLRQAIRLLGSEDYEKNQKHYEAINEITDLFSTLSLIDCLVETFKQSIYDTEEFKRAWQNDNTGEATPQWFIAAALRQSLSRVIFIENTRELRKLLRDDVKLIKPTRKAFIEHVLPLDINKQGVESFYQWLNSIPTIDVSIEENTVQFGVNQTKFSLLFSITSELILNALKYWSGTGQIQIRWYKEQDYYIFTIKNVCQKNASSNLVGTHKGLAFIKRLMELLGEQAYFTPIAEDLSFTAELKLHKTLLENDA